MAASSNAVLLDYESNIEDAVAAYLETAISGTTILTPRTPLSDVEELPTPRVAVTFTIGGTFANQQANRATDGGEYDSMKSGTLQLVCAARRDASGQSLGTLRGKVRVAMLKPTAALNGTSLPYYQFITIREGGSAYGSNAINDEITGTVSYSVDFAIKTDQWAAS